ncbi:MAG: hypothetical protein ACRYGK_17035 [Janthinobacterium lividum]
MRALSRPHVQSHHLIGAPLPPAPVRHPGRIRRAGLGILMLFILATVVLASYKPAVPVARPALARLM